MGEGPMPAPGRGSQRLRVPGTRLRLLRAISLLAPEVACRGTQGRQEQVGAGEAAEAQGAEGQDGATA
eukprot:2730303-Alexandrium_andersonii.AAC.1